MKPKELLRYTQADVDARSRTVVEPRLRKLFGVDVRLKEIGAGASVSVDAGNPAIWSVVFQAGRIVVLLSIGSARHLVGDFDVASVADAARRAGIVGALRDAGVIDAQELAAFRRAHPDKARIAELRQAILAKARALETLKREIAALKAELAAEGG